MTNRRGFLQIGLAVSTLSLATRARAAAVAATVAPAATVPLYKALYDPRFPASVAFARRTAAQGVAVQAIEGDMTAFWYEDLYHRWRQSPVAIAGLTAHGALFCLEQLAWDQRMRVVFRATHTQAAACVAHELEGPSTLLAAAAAAVGAPNWAEALADLVTRCPSGRTKLAATRALTTAPHPSLAATALFSWVIAGDGRSRG